MIITHLMGGLGNQMFQYAAGRALALRFGAPCKLALAGFEAGGTLRKYMLHAFPIATTKAMPEDFAHMAPFADKIFQNCTQGIIAEPSYNYWPGFTSLVPPVYLAGYWQQEDYFLDAAESIRKDFTFPALPCPEANDLAAAIRSCATSVCIHIRRGDYAADPTVRHVHGLCSLEYYAQALGILARKVRDQLSLFLFTDDPAWVRRNFDAQGHPATIVDFPEHHDQPWHDMHLMSLGVHHIIANSSFSWWGAWLSSGKGMVIAPKFWFALPARRNDSPVPVRWIKV